MNIDLKAESLTLTFCSHERKGNLFDILFTFRPFIKDVSQSGENGRLWAHYQIKNRTSHVG